MIEHILPLDVSVNLKRAPEGKIFVVFIVLLMLIWKARKPKLTLDHYAIGKIHMGYRINYISKLCFYGCKFRVPNKHFKGHLSRVGL